MKENKNQSFIQGAFVLLIAGVMVKIIGMFVKIPLTNLYGAEGNGIYSFAYFIYTFMYVVSTAGLPVAVSRMVAEANALGRKREVRRIATVALKTFLLIGAVFSLVIVLGIDIFTKYTTSSAHYAILAVAPMVFFACVVSAIRGYFQGMSNMTPTAVSQVLEALGKLAIGLSLAYWLSSKGYSLDIVVAGAIGGVTLGTMISAIYMCVLFIRNMKRTKPEPSADESITPTKDILQRLIYLAIPITIGASVMSLTNLIDAFVFMNRLQEGCNFTEVHATYLYGVYQMSVTLFNIPPTLVVNLGVSVIPAIAGAIALRNRERAVRLTETAFRMTGIITFPCAFGMAAVPGAILSLIYYKLPEAAAEATPLLVLLCPAMFFVSMVSVTNAILQALGRERAPIRSMAIGGAVKLVTNFILVGLPVLNVHGAPIGTCLCYATITVLNIRLIKREGVELSFFRVLARPFASAAVMGIFAWLIIGPVSALIGSKLGVLATVGLSAILYLLLLLATKALPKEDIIMLPKGEKIAKLLRIK